MNIFFGKKRKQSRRRPNVNNYDCIRMYAIRYNLLPQNVRIRVAVSETLILSDSGTDAHCTLK